MKAKSILLGLLVATSLISCKKEGCIDPDAINYSSEANKDDNSCSYEGGVIFWYDQQVSQDLINDGATSLIIEVNGQNAASTGTNVYWTAEPNCGDPGSISVSMSLGDSKAQTYSYRIVDQTGWVYWESTVTIQANTCQPVQLI